MGVITEHLNQHSSQILSGKYKKIHVTYMYSISHNCWDTTWCKCWKYWFITAQTVWLNIEGRGHCSYMYNCIYKVYYLTDRNTIQMVIVCTQQYSLSACTYTTDSLVRGEKCNNKGLPQDCTGKSLAKCFNWWHGSLGEGIGRASYTLKFWKLGSTYLTAGLQSFQPTTCLYPLDWWWKELRDTLTLAVVLHVAQLP